MRILIILIIKLVLLICIVAKFFPKRLCLNMNIFLLTFEILEVRIAWAESLLKLKEIFILLLALKWLELQPNRFFLIFRLSKVSCTFLMLLLSLNIHILILLILISWIFVLFKIIFIQVIIRAYFLFCCFYFLHRLFIINLVKEIII